MRRALNGEVVCDDDQWLYDWFGISAFSPSTVRRALAENPEGEELVLEINSPGGDVYSGFEIYSVLRSAQGVKTRAEVQSLAASAASTLMLGADEAWISPVAEVMIHLPATVTIGDREDHRASIRMLDTVADGILEAYVAKSRGKKNRDELRRMMASATWLTARDALEAGLVDGILFQAPEVAALPQAVTNAVGGGIRAIANSAVRPGVEWMRGEYERRVRAGAAPAEGHPVPNAGEGPALVTGGPPLVPVPINDSWRDMARLKIEKERFKI